MQSFPSNSLIQKILGVPSDLPEDPWVMFNSFKSSNYPIPPEAPQYLIEFYHVLERVLRGKEFREFKPHDKLERGYAHFFISRETEDADWKLPIRHLGLRQLLGGKQLREIPQIAILPKPEGLGSMDMNSYLQLLVGSFIWNMSDRIWWVGHTDCTFSGLNASRPTFNWRDNPNFISSFVEDIVPKVVMGVHPIPREDLLLLEGPLSLEQRIGLTPYKELINVGPLLTKSQAYPSYRRVRDFKFRARLDEHIAGAYLNEKNGMAWGFTAFQLPTKLEKVYTYNEFEDMLSRQGRSIRETGEDYYVDDKGQLYMHFNIEAGAWVPKEKAGRYVMPLTSEISVATIASGEPKDRVTKESTCELSLRNGQVAIILPAGHHSLPVGFNPSYDTIHILGHAVGNLIAASLMNYFNPESYFPNLLEKHGVSFGHAHVYPFPDRLKAKTYFGGYKNIKGPCSAPITGRFSMRIPIDAAFYTLAHGFDFEQLVQYEASHGFTGTNASLFEFANDLNGPKYYSWDERVVDQAREYAQEHGQYIN